MSAERYSETSTRHLQSDHDGQSEEDAIVAEIAARLIQWRELHPGLIESRPYIWLTRIACLAEDNPDALWLYLSLQTGNLSALTETYAEQAAKRGTSRQRVEQRRRRALTVMTVHFPELSAAIHDLDKHFRPHRGIHHDKSAGTGHNNGSSHAG